jgi:hypothetical protein
MKFPKIQRAIDTELFMRGLCTLPKPPLPLEVSRLGESVPLATDHIDLLLEWGGAHLDEICIKAVSEVRRVRGYVVFADDYNGFIYQYDSHGAVFQEDTDGGEFKKVAESIREFIDEILLGPKCVASYGEDWLQELRKRQMA